MKSSAIHRRLERRNFLTAMGFLLPNIIGFAIFTAYPVVYSLVMSFFDWPTIGEKKFIGLKNYIQLFTADSLFSRVLTNTLSYVVFYIIFNIIIALVLAVWLTSKIQGTNFYRSVFFLPQVAPLIATTMIWKWMFLPNYGLFNNFLGLFGVPDINWLGDSKTAMAAIVIMSVWQGFGYNMIIFISALHGVPASLREAATIDGCGAIRTFLRIKLPMMSPSIFFATVMTVISSFQMFDQTFVATNGGPAYSTSTIVLYMYQNGFMYMRMGYAAAIAWVLFIIIFAITIIQMVVQKNWVVYE